MVVLYPASPKNGDITHYYVVVVPDELTHGRRPDDFKIDEVPGFYSTSTVDLSCLLVGHGLTLVEMFNCIVDECIMNTIGR